MEEHPDESGPEQGSEGVRIIGPREAAEAVERGEAASRKSNEPRFGDRPASPDDHPKGPRPTLRFPLADSEDVSEMVRPAVRPARSSADEQPRSLFSISSRSSSEPAKASDEGGAPKSEGENRPPPEGVVIPHWTEPGTGEIPAALASERDDDDEAWRSFAEAAPRWRDEAADFDERDDISALGGEDSRVGALDPDAPGEDELLSFDDLDQPKPKRPPRAAPKGPRPAAGAGRSPSVRPPAAAPAADRPAAKRPPTKRVAASSSQRARRPPGEPAARRAGSGSGERDVPTAVGVGVGLGLAALALLWIGPGAMMVLVTAVVFLASAEFFTATRRAGYQPAQLLGIGACVAFPLATFWKGTAAYPVVLGLTMMAGFLWYILGAGEERPTLNLGVTLLGVVWIGGLASFAGLLLGVPEQGPSLLLATLLVAVAHDVGGFFVGRAFGRAPLTELSPHKTVEGLFGALVAAILAGVILVGVVGISPFGDSLGDSLWLGLVVGAATAVGDLCESLVKRDLGVKDMGHVLPGHGGVLDRMDGILFALPATWYLMLALFG